MYAPQHPHQPSHLHGGLPLFEFDLRAPESAFEPRLFFPPPPPAAPASAPAGTAAFTLAPRAPSALSMDWLDTREAPASSGVHGNATADGTARDSNSPPASAVSVDGAAPHAPGSARSRSKDVSNVVIACKQCRARKIKCDSTRPACHNCVRRSNGCEYDSAPKRRGPDKVPGTRRRAGRARADTAPDAVDVDASLDGGPSRRKRRRTDGGAGGEYAGMSGTGGSPPTAASAATPLSPVAPPPMPARPGHARGKGSISRLRAPPPITLPALPINAAVTVVQDGAGGHAPSYPPAPAHKGYGLNPKLAAYGALADAAAKAAALAPGLDAHGYERAYLQTGPGVGPHPGMRAVPGSAKYDLGIEPTLPVPMPAANDRWWEELVAQYSSTPEQSVQDIEADLTFVFTTPTPTLAIVHVPLLLQTLRAPAERARLQPALVLAALALATLMRSSALELGTAGATRALWLRDAAQAHADAALGAGWADVRLAQAALILALFEGAAHPRAAAPREAAALSQLDRALAAARVRARDADAGASTFVAGMCPVVFAPPPARSPGGSPHAHPPHSAALSASSGLGSPASAGSVHSPVAGPRARCNCTRPTAPGPAAWDGWELARWGAGAVRAEEARRTGWAALGLGAAHAARSAVFEREPPPLALLEPGGYALLFPDEALGAPRARESPWALLSRATLLFAGAILHLYSPASVLPAPGREDARAEFAVEAWTEAQAIEDALAAHACVPDPEMVYNAREYLFNTRKLVSQVFRRMQDIDPKTMPSRRQAEEYIFYQDQIATRVNALAQMPHDPQFHSLSRRPWQANWFATQVAICLQLWSQDNTLAPALELAKKFLVPCDVLGALWPCDTQTHKVGELRKRLDQACAVSGVPLPLSPVHALAPVLRARPADAFGAF